MQTLERNIQAVTAETHGQNVDVILAREYYEVALLEKRAQDLIDSRSNIEHDTWQNEPQQNARTAIFEDLTAKGHLSRVEFDGDVDDINQKVLQRLLNAWSDKLPEWEQKRRFYEIVEELIIQQAWEEVKTGKLPPDTMIGTVSDYPEGVDDKEAWRIGYRSLNRKGMTRTTTFEQTDSGQSFRVLEQISRSNSNDGSSGAFLRTPSDPLNVISNQFITTKRQCPEGVIGIQKTLDNHRGPHIRYGEDERYVYPPSPGYEELRVISYEREAQVEQYVQRLADFEKKLNVMYKRGDITYQHKLSHISSEREKIVDEICLLNPSYAKDARGEESAGYFEQAALAMASGDDYLGRQHFENAIRSADPMASAVCGGIGVNENEPGLNEEGEQMYTNAKDARKNWKWKKGLCTIRVCPTRPDKTEVGPCEVCRSCQALFDEKFSLNEIENLYKSNFVEKQTKKQPGALEILSEGVRKVIEKDKQDKKIKKLKAEQIKKLKEAEELAKAA